MTDGLRKWEDVIKRVESHDDRIAKLEQDAAERKLDLAMLTDIVHGARKARAARGKVAKKRTRK